MKPISLINVLATVACAATIHVAPAVASPPGHLAKTQAPRPRGKPTGRPTASPLAKRGTTRHAAAMAKARAAMIAEITGDGINSGDTPGFFAFLETPGSMVHTGGDDLHAAKQYRLSGLGSGNVTFTTLLPVSGHTGFANAQSYAKSNVYEMQIIYPDGSIQKLPNVRSTDLVTEGKLNVTLRPGLNKLQFWPDQSGGVPGYYEGRTLELTWDGK